METIKTILTAVATDQDVFKLPAGSAMHAVLALFNQHNGQPAEATTLARRAEEGRNQHMGAYSRRQGIEKDKELMAKPPAKIVHGSEEFDNDMAYSKKDMEYKPHD